MKLNRAQRNSKERKDSRKQHRGTKRHEKMTCLLYSNFF